MKEKYIIDTEEAAREFLNWIEEEKPEKEIDANIITIDDEEFILKGKALVLVMKEMSEYNNIIKNIVKKYEDKNPHIDKSSKEEIITSENFSKKIIESCEQAFEITKENNHIPFSSDETFTAPVTGDYYIDNSGARFIKKNDVIKSNLYDNSLIFGKNNTEGIVAIEVQDNNVLLFKNDLTVETIPYEYWILTNRPTKNSEPLDGNLFYKYKTTFIDYESYKKSRGILYTRKADFYAMYDDVEAAMMSEGLTLFKGLKVQDVSVLSFDIEARGLIDDNTSIPYAGYNSKVYMITNTYRNENGKIIRKMFSLDEYDDNDVDMIEAWCKWVQEINPSIICGHNIFGYDFPYLSYCYGTRNGTNRELELGRDCSEIKYNERHSNFRKDGSQTYKYKNIKCFGRQIIDTFFLSIKYDYSRKYPSYGLKSIIEYEGLIKKDRQFYDASQIWKNWNNIKEREKIKAYGKDDADDSLALYDLMIPQYFYYTQSIPMPFQTINNTATGRQINAFLVRAYLQEGHSIPKTSEKKEYGGGISFGNPGVWEHVNKADIASLYPSIMITEKVYDKLKDPKGYFLEMVKYFTNERLENKRLANETKDRYYKDIEQAQKIVINSAYGTLGTPGLNFNNSNLADFVTAKGREILQMGIDWAESQKFQIVNVDTDSFSYTTGKKLSDEEFETQLKDLNSKFNDGIVWEDDGRYKAVLVVKAKNYALMDYNKKVPIKIKGSGLKASMKERALQEFINDIITALLEKKKDHLYSIYNTYAQEVIFNTIDITRWTSKKTVTSSILNPTRTTEEKLLNAIKGKGLSEGDKFKVYFRTDESIACEEDYNNDHHVDKLLEKIYKTLKIFENVIDIDAYPNYKIKKNKELLGL